MTRRCPHFEQIRDELHHSPVCTKCKRIIHELPSQLDTPDRSDALRKRCKMETDSNGVDAINKKISKHGTQLTGWERKEWDDWKDSKELQTILAASLSHVKGCSEKKCRISQLTHTPQLLFKACKSGSRKRDTTLIQRLLEMETFECEMSLETEIHDALLRADEISSQVQCDNPLMKTQVEIRTVQYVRCYVANHYPDHGKTAAIAATVTALSWSEIESVFMSTPCKPSFRKVLHLLPSPCALLYKYSAEQPYLPQEDLQRVHAKLCSWMNNHILVEKLNRVATPEMIFSMAMEMMLDIKVSASPTEGLTALRSLLQSAGTCRTP